VRLLASKREEVLQGLFVVLGTIDGPKVLRNEVLPERVSEAGVIILRDGEPGCCCRRPSMSTSTVRNSRWR